MAYSINDNDTTAKAVLTAIAELGEASAAKIAESSGVAYSTTNKKLRLLESAGLAGASRGSDTKVRWQLTDPGRAHANSVARGQPTTQDTPQPVTDAEAPGDSTMHIGTTPAVGGNSPTSDKPTDHEYEPHTTAPVDYSSGQDAHAAEADDPVPHAEEPSTAQPSGNGDTADPPATSPATQTATHASIDPAGGSQTGTARRRKGALYNEVLTVLQKDPEATFTVAEVRKKVDSARHGSGEAAASAGAVYNALVKAVADRVARQAAEKPATFQAV